MTRTARLLNDTEMEAACGLITTLTTVVALDKIPTFVVVVALSELLANLAMQVPEDQRDAFHDAIITQMKFAYRGKRGGAEIGAPQGSA